mmetsp:Transcript_147328/g.367341  ORF Transcript_147328/g.367341 Transcript_147328/m.367341 type:complete len:250 (+) Transcript_147328:863-1612(+)
MASYLPGPPASQPLHCFTSCSSRPKSGFPKLMKRFLQMALHVGISPQDAFLLGAHLSPPLCATTLLFKLLMVMCSDPLRVQPSPSTKQQGSHAVFSSSTHSRVSKHSFSLNEEQKPSTKCDPRSSCSTHATGTGWPSPDWCSYPSAHDILQQTSPPELADGQPSHPKLFNDASGASPLKAAFPCRLHFSAVIGVGHLGAGSNGRQTGMSGKTPARRPFTSLLSQRLVLPVGPPYESNPGLQATLHDWQS